MSNHQNESETPLIKAVESDFLLKEIYDSTVDYGIFTIDLTGIVTTWNVGAERITGFSPTEILGKDYAVVFTPDDRARNEPEQEMRIAQTTGRSENYRWHVRKDGSVFWADGILTLLENGPGHQIGYLKMFRDITERKMEESELHRAATSDMLTGLPNRYNFELHAKDMIAIANRSKQLLALHLIDLDRFKQLNDSLGHHAGDNLLRQSSQRMRRNLREGDFLARLGGDEFVLLQPNMPSAQSATDLATKLQRELARPFDLDAHEFKISASIGISICPIDATDLDQLMKKADLALYRAKADGRGRFHFFTKEVDSIAHERNRALAEMRLAIARKEFWIAYQPKVSFLNGRAVGVEALLRCSNAALSGMPIEHVIDLGIESGLMKTLSAWVMREACGQLRKWKDAGMANLRMSINLCAPDLTDNETLHFIDELVAEMSLQHSDLEIEITERQALEIEKNGVSVLNTLRMRGLKIALDDFGTGYSALRYLRDLPVTTVKLDKSFLVGIPDDVQGCAVVKAVIDLSHALELEIIAEGVETNEQAAFLEAAGCTALQGHLISVPLPEIDMTNWLVAERNSQQIV